MKHLCYKSVVSPGDPDPGLEAELVWVAEYRRALRRVVHRVGSVVTLAGLTVQRYDLLLMIRAGGGGPLRPTDLASLLEMRQTAVTELVKRTEEAGLIERRQSEEDGRAWLLQVTPEGERRLLQAVHALRDDREQLVAAMRELDVRFRASWR
jgi:DNA-binding MarR family transcriptional regulator